ncbi:MAG: hypothetical protein Q8O16_07475 [Dehalococcoidia bacterium]|nr:hypothetical protein [Dehalococcoidia bacterium]
MRRYIFITTEGSIYQPHSDSPEPDIENMQVTGFGQGDTVKDALMNLPGLHEYLVKTSFDEILALELKNDTRKYFSLRDTTKKYMKAA